MIRAVDRSTSSLCTSVSGNAPKWAQDTSRAVGRFRGTFMSVLACIVQVLKAPNWLLHARDTIEAVDHSVASLGLEILPNELDGASERLTTPEVHS